MASDKQQLRDKYKAQRLAMSRQDVASRSRIIGRGLLAEVDWSQIKYLHAYAAMAALNEVDLSDFLSVIGQEYPQIKVFISSAAKNQARPTQLFDLILVPTLAFDENNYRLGWGGGWYDRFLAGQPQALKIGLAYQAGLVKDGLPHEPHDIRLDKIITE
jgi:5-formyltetrahydrofolate cyclo-ligase